MHRSVPAAVLLALAVALGGCGDDTDSADTSETTAAASGEGVAVTGQWARTSPMVNGAGAAYMTVTSGEDDAIVAASVDPSVAATVELHETTMADDAMSSTTMADAMGDTSMGESMDDGMDDGMGEMTMVPVDRIELAAGKAVELKPGGLHIMLLDLAAPLEAGTDIEITLDFEKADDLVVTVPVRTDAP